MHRPIAQHLRAWYEPFGYTLTSVNDYFFILQDDEGAVFRCVSCGAALLYDSQSGATNHKCEDLDDEPEEPDDYYESLTEAERIAEGFRISAGFDAEEDDDDGSDY